MKRLIGLVVLLMAVPAVCEGQVAIYCGPADDHIAGWNGTGGDFTPFIGCSRITEMVVKMKFTPNTASSSGITLEYAQSGEEFEEFAEIATDSNNAITEDGETVGQADQPVMLQWTLDVIPTTSVLAVFRVKITHNDSGVTWNYIQYWADWGSSKSQLPGDFNGSGKVEQADLDLVLLDWGKGPHNRSFGWLNAQPPDGGLVDQEELDRVLNNWGATCP